MEDEETHKIHLRDRTVSLGPSSQVKSQVRSSVHNRASLTSPRSVGRDIQPSEIVSPVPRRSLLSTSNGLYWFRGPHSDAGSQPRCFSPISPTSSAGSVQWSSGSNRLSFNALQRQDMGARGIHIPSSGSMQSSQDDSRDDSGAGRRWIRWMHKRGLKVWVIPSAIVASVWVKWCIGLGSYSGYATPPMFGDYEAQRHWMELTMHLPPREWYTYDLQYWGLDYPPLTAYVSWLCGKIGSLIDPTWFTLDVSRGIESYASKLYMRATVIALDLLVYVPALYAFARIWHRSRSTRAQHAAFLILLFQPALLLIDFGHFQYNSVMLGLTLLAVGACATGLDLVGAICFVHSLAFKQMSLYYAPAIGSYLLGKCLFLGPIKGARLFIQLAVVTLTAFIVLFSPFLPPFSPFFTLSFLISRIFPFARGIFEDKVANFWCFTNVTLLKWKVAFAGKEGQLIKVSAALTFIGFLPAIVSLLWGAYKTRLYAHVSTPEKKQDDESVSSVAPQHIPAPTIPLLPYALLTSSMSFFLFSFQVHEKTILLPLMPLTLLMSGATAGDEVYSWGVLGNVVGVFSMWPLLKRDGLGVQYIAVLLLWCRLVGHDPFRVRSDAFVHLLSTAVHAAMFLLHFLEVVITPPQRYPDLFPVLNVLVSTPVFGLIWLWSIKRSIEVGWALGGLPGSGTEKQVKDADNTSIAGSTSNVLSATATGFRRGPGARAVSLGYESGKVVSGGYRDPRRRAVERLRESSIEMAK